jgi:hypothetical protein
MGKFSNCSAVVLLSCLLLFGCGSGMHGGALNISTNSLSSATMGTPYQVSLAATGGNPPYRWSITSANLPPGLALSSSGVISGTGMTAASATVTFAVRDLFGGSASKAMVVRIVPLSVTPTPATPNAPLVITSATTLPSATVGSPYSFAATASGGVPPYTWSAATGTLPSGFSISSTGTLSGTPAAAGSSTPSLIVSDSTGTTASALVALNINAATASVPSLVITSATTLPSATVGSPYSFTATASGGVPPYTWSAATGSLPVGLTLSANGTLAGTPDVTGATTPSFFVADSTGATAAALFSLNVTAAPTAIAPLIIASAPILPSAIAGSSYSFTAMASGGVPPYTWSAATGSLPAGLTLSANGILAGVPTTTGSSTPSFFVADSTGATASALFSLNITAAATSITPLVITSATHLPSATVGSPYSFTATASGGTSPYSWSISGALPSGLSLSTTGTLSGTPATAGSSTPSLLVSDSTGATASALISINVSLNATPATTCIATPATVPQGTNVTVVATASGFSSSSLTYSFTATSGTIVSSGSSAILSTAGLTAGPLSVSCAASDTHGAAATSGTSITVTLANTSTSLIATPNPAVTGQSVVLTAQVAGSAGVPAGSVTFFDGAATLGTNSLDASGTASLTAPGLANGSHLVSAQYVGNSLYAASASTQLQVDVAQAATGEQALQADSFVDSVGIATHLAYTDTPYFTAWPQVLSEIQSLGLRHIRDGFHDWPSSSLFIAEHQALAAAGVACTYLVTLDDTTTPQILQSFASKVHDLEALEAPNECDAGLNCGGGDLIGVANVVAFLPTVYAAGQALHVPVLGPSFTVDWAYAAAGNIASEMTYNNLHVYFGGRNPGSTGWGAGDAQGHSYGSLDWWIDQGDLDAPGVPSVITESGYISYPLPLIPFTIPESVEASYIPRTLLLTFNRGIKRIFLYELLDEVSSPGYGLLRSDLSEKPAFIALKNLLSLLSDQGPVFSPGKLDYTITGADTTLSHTLLQKRDGSYWLILWSEQSSYDPALNLPTPVTAQNVTLKLNGPAIAKQLVQFDSTGNAATTPVTGSGSTLSLTISDQLTIVQITPP